MRRICLIKWRLGSKFLLQVNDSCTVGLAAFRALAALRCFLNFSSRADVSVKSLTCSGLLGSYGTFLGGLGIAGTAEGNDGTFLGGLGIAGTAEGNGPSYPGTLPAAPEPEASAGAGAGGLLALFATSASTIALTLGGKSVLGPGIEI